MSDLLKALAVTAEVVGTDWSDAAAEYIAGELKAYPLSDVQMALKTCTKDLRGKRLTLSEILDRLPSGHPGPEEAWATISRAMNNDALSLVWSDEMREAYGMANNLADDPVAARMAFKETYQKLVGQARAEGRQPKWSVSRGADKADLERVILEGVKQGRLSAPYAQRLLPHPDDPQTVALLESLCPRLLS